MGSRLLQIAKWLTLASFLLLLIGAIGIALIDDDSLNILDPSVTNMAELSPDSSKSISLENRGIYVALRIPGEETESNLRLIDSLGEEERGRTANWYDFPRTGTDGTIYDTVRVFEINNDGDFILYNEGNNTLWLVDETSYQADILGEFSFLIVSLGCCLGIITGILALLLALIGWRRRSKETNVKIGIVSDILIENQNTKIKIIKSEGKIPDPFIDNRKNTESDTVKNNEKDNFWQDWDNQE